MQHISLQVLAGTTTHQQSGKFSDEKGCLSSRGREKGCRRGLAATIASSVDEERCRKI